MPRKDRNITPSVTQKLQELGYNVADWDDSLTTAPQEIRQVLATASKSDTGQPGYPDRVYVNKREKLMVLVEEKPSVKEHFLPEKQKGAVNGIKWYLGRFLNINLPQKLKNYFDNWKILGIAASGNLSLEHLHEFTCFTFDTANQKIIPLPQVKNFMTEEQFLALFNSLDEEKAVAQVSTSSKKINNLLRSIDSQKRPVLLSALMICLHRVKRKTTLFHNDFPDHYKTYSAGSIITNVFDTVQKVLQAEGIPQEKLAALDTELAFLKTDQTLNNDSAAILKEILVELETAVIPLFESQFASNSNYDIIGKFYEEFLKYAGVSNVKRGIVLTPRHITTLFTKLVDLRDNDKIVDICCGTGAFLIAGMNTLLERIGKSSRSDKDKATATVKENQLLGFEVNSTMYICAVSNMLFRGDGKSQIYHYDSIRDPKANNELREFKATIGFINPPYSGKETTTDPTPKEITFLAKLLGNCSRYAVMIAPISAFCNENEKHIRANLLKKHTLKYVINMPDDLFQPNASTNTAVAVFETNRSFDYENDEVVFYDLRDDGFVLSKNQGRTDVYGRWDKIEKELLDSLKPTSVPDGIKLVRTKIKPGDEWTIYAHSKTDYSTLCEEDFIKSISDYMIFEAKKNLDILDQKLTETELLGALSAYYGGQDEN
jgi:type I restriction-modification system DNA methylase subunit